MNLSRLGFPKALPRLPTRGVVAPAARQTQEPTPLARAHVAKMLAANLNIESSAAFLATTPHFSQQLRSDMAAVVKAAKLVNLRMMQEGHESLTAAIDALNQRGNLLNEMALTLVSVPPDVALAALKAAADVVERRMYPKPRKARRVTSQPA